MESNPFKAWNKYKSKRLEQSIGAVAGIFLDINLDEIECSEAQLRLALANIRNKMFENTGQDTTRITTWFNNGTVIDNRTNTNHTFGTRLRAEGLDNDAEEGAMFVESRTYDQKTKEEVIKTRFGYQWNHSQYDEVSITSFDVLDNGERKVLTGGEKLFDEAVSIIVQAHEKILGTDPRLLSV